MIVSDDIPDKDTVSRPQHGLGAGFTVTRVVDGDTVEGTITIPVTVRLLDCWAPELRPRHKGKTEAELSDIRTAARASKLHLATLAEGAKGTLLIPWGSAKDMGDVLTFGRVLGHVWVDGQYTSLSTQQVASGHATSAKET